MEPQDAYKYCLICGGKLQKSTDFLLCSQCGYRLYHNPAPCNAVIIEHKGNILLVRRAVDPQKGFWDLPGGFIKPYETYEESVRREIKEELGCEVKNIKIIDTLPNTYPFQGVNIATLDIFAKAELETEDLTPSDDIDYFQFFSPSEIPFDKIAFESTKKALKKYLAQKAQD